MTEDQIKLAGKLMKIVHLASLPGMDEVAIKLNCGLTYDEEERAKTWARAFELAERGGNAFALAAELHKEMM